ncbi:hypothetical protein D3C81_837380 [compost metagenome]
MRLKSIGGVRKVMWKFTRFSFRQHGIVAYRRDTAKSSHLKFLGITLSFRSLSIHDATLSAIYVSWEAARRDIRLLPVGLPPHLLVFEGFTHIELPRRESWGPSSSINNSTELQAGQFEIELQSGDTLRIEATHWAFRPEVA